MFIPRQPSHLERQMAAKLMSTTLNILVVSNSCTFQIPDLVSLKHSPFITMYTLTLSMSAKACTTSNVELLWLVYLFRKSLSDNIPFYWFRLKRYLTMSYTADFPNSHCGSFLAHGCHARSTYRIYGKSRVRGLESQM